MNIKIADKDNLVALLNHLGIDQGNEPNEIVFELMNFTLQTLGAIRMIVQQQEIIRMSNVAATITTAVETTDDGTNQLVLRETFASAVSTITNKIVCGREIHDLDPSRHLIESFPHSAKIGNKLWLALQWAIAGKQILSNNDELEVEDIRVKRFRTLATAYPEMCGELDKEGRSMLHIAARLDSEELLREVANHSHAPHGRGIDFANLNGALPVHNAARFCQSVEVFNLAAALGPEAINLANNDGILPLHWAAAKNTSVGIIQSLLQLAPAAAFTANNEGYLPLHCAGQNSALDVVRVVYEANPEGIKVCDDEGGYPLHHACCFNRNLDVVQLLYDAFPPAMSFPQYDEVTPIHLAAAQNDSPEVLRFILRVMPSAAFATDKEGWLALHCLANTDAVKMTPNRIECLKMLIKANPKGVTSAELLTIALSPYAGSVAGHTATDEVMSINTAASSSTVKSTDTPYLLAFKQNHGDLVLRMILNANPQQDMIACGNLNWKARKWAIIGCLQCLKQPIPNVTDFPVSEGDEDLIGSGSIEDLRVENVLRLLCFKYIAETSRNIPGGVLRKIIKFL